MLISEMYVQKYQKLYYEHFGEKLTKEAAYDGCVKLLQLFKIVYTPMTVEQFKKIRQRFNHLHNIDESEV